MKSKIMFIIIPCSIVIAIFIIYSKRINSPYTPSKNKIKQHIIEEDIAWLANGDITKRFLHIVNLPKQNIPYQSIIYGNKDVGYFRSNNFIDQAHHKLELIIPTFRKEISFYRESCNNRHCSYKFLFSKKFRSPVPILFHNLHIDTFGHFTPMFYMLTGVYVPNKLQRSNRSSYVLVINHLGEVIWMYISNRGTKRVKKYGVMKKIKSGLYAVMFGEKAATFEIINYHGDMLYSFAHSNTTKPIIHHDFAIDYKNKKVFFLSNVTEYFRDWSSKRYNESWTEFFLRLISPPVKILGSAIVEFDLKTEKSLLRWNFLKQFSLLNTKKFISTIKKKNLALHAHRWWVAPKEKAQLDLIHANSIEFTDEGVLVSLRNLNKLVMLSHDFKKVLWTLGSDKFDTYHINPSWQHFFHQHHATILPSKDILLMNNGQIKQGVKEIGSSVYIVRRGRYSNESRVVWKFKPPVKFSIGTRGSAYYLKNGNIVSFFPNTIGFGSDFIFEVDPATKKAIGYIEIYFNVLHKSISVAQRKKFQKLGVELDSYIKRIGGGNRALPLAEIGPEQRIDLDKENDFRIYITQGK